MRALVAGLLASGALLAQGPAQTPAFASLEFLFGDWTAKGGDVNVGQGAGEFSFTPQLNRNIVVRKNFAEYTSGKEAGTRHDDLMVVYRENGALRAIYFDSEGHTIHYLIKSPAANIAVFESDAAQPGPKYKLTYSLTGAELAGKFEVNGKPYLTWTSVRKQ